MAAKSDYLGSLVGLGDGRVVFTYRRGKSYDIWALDPSRSAVLLRFGGYGWPVGSVPGRVLYGDDSGVMITDGTVAGSSLLISGLKNAWQTVADGDRIWIAGTRAGITEIWVSDGTSQGTQRAVAMSEILLLQFRGAGVMYFTAIYATHRVLLKTDGKVTSPAPELSAAGSRRSIRTELSPCRVRSERCPARPSLQAARLRARAGAAS